MCGVGDGEGVAVEVALVAGDIAGGVLLVLLVGGEVLLLLLRVLLLPFFRGFLLRFAAVFFPV